MAWASPPATVRPSFPELLVGFPQPALRTGAVDVDLLGHEERARLVDEVVEQILHTRSLGQVRALVVRLSQFGIRNRQFCGQELDDVDDEPHGDEMLVRAVLREHRYRDAEENFSGSAGRGTFAADDAERRLRLGLDGAVADDEDDLDGLLESGPVEAVGR